MNSPLPKPSKNLILLGLPVLRNQPPDVRSDDLLGGIAKDPLGTRIPARDRPRERLAQDRVRGRVYNRGEMGGPLVLGRGCRSPRFGVLGDSGFTLSPRRRSPPSRTSWGLGLIILRSFLVGHRRRKTFSTIVPMIETRSMSPIGTNTVTLSDFHESVPGTRSTPSLARPSAPSPTIARTTALTSRTLPAVSIRRGYPGRVALNRQVASILVHPGSALSSMREVVGIREFQARDLDVIVEFSLRAWEPVFTSLREVLGDPI